MRGVCTETPRTTLTAPSPPWIGYRRSSPGPPCPPPARIYCMRPFRRWWKRPILLRTIRRRAVGPFAPVPTSPFVAAHQRAPNQARRLRTDPPHDGMRALRKSRGLFVGACVPAGRVGWSLRNTHGLVAAPEQLSARVRHLQWHYPGTICSVHRFSGHGRALGSAGRYLANAAGRQGQRGKFGLFHHPQKGLKKQE